MRYVAIFEDTRIAEPEAAETKELVDIPAIVEPAVTEKYPWGYVLAPIAVLAIAGTGLGVALTMKRRNESAGGTEEDA